MTGARHRLPGRARDLAAAGALACWLALAPALAGEVTVFAAASTAEAMTDIARRYEAAGGEVRISFAASSTLARQIEYGAPADIFLSANRQWMDYLAERDLILSQSRKTILGNRLVLVAPADSAMKLAIAPGFPLARALDGGRLAMGDPDHVPAGIYGRQALEKLGVWRQVGAAVARAADVRAALALVARGEARAAIVYATDAAVVAEVRVVARFPVESHAPVRYEVALVAAGNEAEARRFLAFLEAPAARELFKRRGFIVDLRGGG